MMGRGCSGAGKTRAKGRRISTCETRQGQTVQLDSVQAGASGSGVVHPVFQSASADGSRVFFTDEQQLTEGSGAAYQKPDLYEFDVDSGILTDLSETGGRESADVLGVVLGSSEDGSYYFGLVNGRQAALA